MNKSTLNTYSSDDQWIHVVIEWRPDTDQITIDELSTERTFHISMESARFIHETLGAIFAEMESSS